MTTTNWHLLNDIAFERLVSILILHNDIEAKNYNRPGPDAGIDIKSSDGKTVYQIKFTTKTENFSKIISEAKKELEKIKKYKDTNHNNFQFWDKVEKWCLITNASCNPLDESKWKEKIETPFKQLTGLKATFIDGVYLETMLLDFPSLKKEYFEGENRTFLSLPEAIQSKTESDPIFDKGFKQNFQGRDKELNEFSKFIKSDKKLILIHGHGGIGKTRFAIEAAKQTNKQEKYNIFWANTATMESSTNWFHLIIHGKKTLLIIDEPTKKRTIEILIEQISILKVSNWKFAIITRSAKNHILEPFKYHKRFISDPIDINPLDKTIIKTLATSLLYNLKKKENSLNDFDDLINLILKVSDGFPIWTVVACELLEKNKSLKGLQNSYGLAKKYLNEMLNSHIKQNSYEKFYQFLKAFAILQPMYTKSYLFDLQLLLNDFKNSEIEGFLNILKKAKIVGNRGRFLEIKTNVIRDYIILTLIGENQEESSEWVEKILNMQGTIKKKSSLQQVARIAYEQKNQGKTETFLDATWDAFIRKAKESSLKELKSLTDDDRKYDTSILDLADSISFSNLPKFIKFIQTIQNNPKESEYVNQAWGEQTPLHHKDIVLKLPRMLFNAGIHAQNKEEVKQVFEEFLSLAEKECSLVQNNSLPFNRLKSVEFIEKLMLKEQYSPYVNIVSDWIIKHLNQFDTLNEDQIEVIKSLTISCFFDLEKTIYNYNDNIVTFNQFSVNPSSKNNICKNKIFKTIWVILNSNKLCTKKRKILWIMLQDYQRKLNFIIKKVSEKDKTEFNKELKDNLNNIETYLTKNHVDTSEFKDIKSIWKWHLKYDKRDDFKKMAEILEKLILEKSNITSDFISLFENDSLKSKQEKFQKYSKKLDSKDKVYSFVEDCFNFSKNKTAPQEVAKILGKKKDLSNCVSKYIHEIIETNKNDPHFKFVCEIISSQASFLREKNKKILFDFLMNYWNQFQIEMKKEFFYIIYHSSPGLMWKVRKEDIQFVSNILNQSKEEFSDRFFLRAISYFSGNVLFVDFNQSKHIIEFVSNNVNSQNKQVVFTTYVEGATDRHFSYPDHEVAFSDQLPFKPKKDMFPWLISLLEYIPSINFNKIQFGGEGLKEIKEILKGKLSVIDFFKLLKKRLDLLKNNDDSLWKNIFLDNNFLKIIDPIKKEDVASKKIKATLKKLLDFNNSNNLLYYKLPSIVNQIDPEGFLIPTLIVERITKKQFLCKKLEDTAPEYEWTRYARYYSINSKPWRVIAEKACHIACSTRIDEEKHSIFLSLLENKPQFFSSYPGQVPSHFYDKVKETGLDFSKESDPNIKEFMKWRHKYAKKVLEMAKLENKEENHG